MALFIGASAHAQYALAEGKFASSAMSITVLLLDADKGVAAASVVVSQGSCSGSISGIGEIVSRRLSISSYQKIPEGERCQVVLEYDRQWKRILVSDNGACSAYQGASCSWRGQMAVRRPD
jgi:hypothetical protein